MLGNCARQLVSAPVLNNMMTCKDPQFSSCPCYKVSQLYRPWPTQLYCAARDRTVPFIAGLCSNGGLKDAADRVGDGVKDAADKAEDGFKDTADKAEDVTKEAGNKTKEGVKIIDDNFNLAGDKITDVVTEVGSEAMAEIAAGAIGVTFGAITMNAGQPVAGAALIMSGTTVIVQVIWSKVDDVKKFGEAVRVAFSVYLKV